MTTRVFYPKTTGISTVMFTIYVIVLLAGTIINLIKSDGFGEWITFLLVSFLYIGICSLIYFAIKSQRIIITKDIFLLKQLGLVRHHIRLKEIEQVRKGKMSGSPIIEIQTKPGKNQKIYPVPFLPFEQDWDDILFLLEDSCGKEIIGEMTLKRDKGELRTWAGY